MRGIESAVAVILLLIMSVALVAVLWMVFGPALKHTSQSTAKSMNKSAEQQAKAAAIANERAACDNMGENAVFLTSLPPTTSVKVGSVYVNITNEGNRTIPVCIYNNSGTYTIACWNGTAFIVKGMNASVKNNATTITVDYTTC